MTDLLAREEDKKCPSFRADAWTYMQAKGNRWSLLLCILGFKTKMKFNKARFVFHKEDCECDKK